MAKKEEELQDGNVSGKLRALQAAMAKIEKDFGKGSIMKLGDEQIENVDVIPTGSLALNAALGVGGYPKGRIIEIYGPKHKRLAVSRHSSMPNTPSTASMRPNSAAMSTICSSRSPTTANRHWKLPTSSSAPRPSTSSWSTLLQP